MSQQASASKVGSYEKMRNTLEEKFVYSFHILDSSLKMKEQFILLGSNSLLFI